MQALPAGGGMLSIAAPAAQIEEALDGVEIAGVNGPAAVSVSGPLAALDRAEQWCNDRGIRVRRLRVSHAFHSSLMDPMLADFETVLRELTWHEPGLPIVCNTTGQQADPHTIATPDYWLTQARQAVLFHDMVTTLADQHVTTYLEVGPDTTLTTLVSQALTANAIPTLRRDHAEDETVLTTLAHLWVTGHRVDWTPVLPAGRRVDLPTYAFQHEHFWLREPAPARTGTDEAFWAAIEDQDVPALAAQLSVAPQASLDAVLPALAAWRRRSREEGVADAWRSAVAWDVVPERSGDLGGGWLAVAGPDADRKCVAGLEAAGIPVRPLGTDWSDAEDNVLLLSCDPLVVLTAVQSLTGSGWSGRLWCVTRGGVSVALDDAPPELSAAQVWGLGRVVGLELSARWGGLVDLPEVVDGHTVARLVGVLADGTEDQVAIRSSGVFARRLRPAAAPDGAPFDVRDTVLISGGTGALGAQVARWAAAHGAAHVVLASRQGERSAGAAALRDELTTLGARISIEACDVADRAAVERLAARLREAGERVGMVVHAAGMPQLTALAAITADEWAAVTGAKVDGATHLDAVFGDDLDAFVMFSSIAATWGSAGQGGYAAANTALDALAERRRRRGAAATSIAWGPWAEAGMARDTAEELARRGIRALAPTTAVTAMHRALSAGDTTVTIADVDWDQFIPTFTALRPSPLFAHYRTTTPAAPAPASDLVRRLAAAGEADRARILLDLVRQQAAGVLGHRTVEAIRDGRGFLDLGFDSLMAVELRNRLIAETGLDLPATLVFDHPNPAALATHLGSRLAPDGASGSIDATIDRLERMLAGAYAVNGHGEEITRRLQALMARWTAVHPPDGHEDEADRLAAATPEEMFDLIAREFGKA